MFILSEYKNWLKDKERKFSYLFVLRNGELVHHEINKSELLLRGLTCNMHYLMGWNESFCWMLLNSVF
ncbi:hypothetical protein EF785_22275 [Escherichia coli]|uniref:Uncharacterized protein n=1 Tax=Salmonella typhimurium TaxID=90371 RepID=A0A5W9YRP0_SALTM|nr:hypothetical protein [Shigella sonnei]EAB6487987.1 hypothetical protein [Salmonella enterica subsp. enterica serovar Typhimurium]EBI8250947.1 hypothetical protein [Salmonella enterica]EBQ9042157.1 hypothetical protein [Salmonella enterica subsp. enterica serovar Saintpaul]EBU8042846.1 hypothetical protein [Salmonella enterica subsp. enterica serovar Alachua]ECI5754202.1 hypothetical protein [Salmonella enterica subsp. enterica]EFN7523510.1 hypothetical protein [Escherichia coli]